MKLFVRRPSSKQFCGNTSLNQVQSQQIESLNKLRISNANYPGNKGSNS